MILVLVALALIWGLGHLFDQPMVRRWTLTFLVLAMVLVAHAVLPADNPVPLMFGGNFASWATSTGLLVLVLAYMRGIRALKARAKPEDAPEQTGTFSDTELDRYARHIVLRELGGPGQKAMKNARVLVIGAGGLGAPSLLYLAAAGVGTIGIVDDDVVDNSNLQRQVIHRDQDIGMPKVFSAQAAMLAQNPFIEVRPYNRRLTEDFARELFADYDLILEGTDNFETRYMVNRVAVALGKPVISAALTQWEGQISLFHPKRGAPCYQCVFPEAPAPDLAPNCSVAGVVGPLPGVMGSMMAMEAVKDITEAGQGLGGRLMIYDGLYAESRVIRVKPRADCPICGSGVA